MKGVALAVVLCAALFASAATAGVPPGVYTGHTKYTPKLYVTVDLQVRSGSADFRVGASAPCDKPGYELGRDVGTYLDPGRPRLTLHAGRFSFTHHDVFTTVGVQIVTTHQTYTLTGRPSASGLTGTVRMIETTNTGITCDTGTLAWAAHRVNAPFPK